MSRGKMRQPTKVELRERLSVAEALVKAQAEEIASLRQGIAGEMFDAPVLAVVGVTEASTPFVEVVRPHPCPPIALDVMASHLARIADASHAESFKVDEARITGLEARMDGFNADLKGVASELQSVGGRIEALTGVVSSLVQGDGQHESA
jgi:hypothetical protein